MFDVSATAGEVVVGVLLVVAVVVAGVLAVVVVEAV